MTISHLILSIICNTQIVLSTNCETFLLKNNKNEEMFYEIKIEYTENYEFLNSIYSKNKNYTIIQIDTIYKL